MSATGLPTFDKTLHQTNRWLAEINEEMGWGDRQLAYHALRAVLHALRDRLTVEESAGLAAQLPLLVRGIYYDGYRPGAVPIKIHKREEFLQRVSEELQQIGTIDPEIVVTSVLRVLENHVTKGEIDQVKHMLPPEIRALWPQ